MHLSKNIKLIRSVLRKTQKEFGEELDASKAMIVSYEKGKAKPDELFISRLCKMGGVKEDDLRNKALVEDDLKIKKVNKVEKIGGSYFLQNPPLKDLAEEIAMIHVLVIEVAKLKAKLTGVEEAVVIDELHQNAAGRLVVKK
jgi:transcriptional regulator with XRE-family HTH domain